MKHFIVTSLFLVFNLAAIAQNDTLKVEKKSVHAIKATGPMKIDGAFTEADWQTAETAKDFTQHFPYPGKTASQQTEVKILYDDQAVYFAVTLHDVSKDSIMKQLSQRDQAENTDIFALSIDTYNDDQNAFQFVVLPSGVQLDMRISSFDEDEAWNAVWFSAVRISDKGWFVEMKIPYSALRFPDQPEQNWGINFARQVRRNRQASAWNYLNPRIDGQVNQYGELTGIKNIKPPLRLSLSPYVSAYYDRYDDGANNIHEDNVDINGGMDLKYGINDAFTLDMTLIPDFGQVQSDNQVLNTTPFEVKYNEYRQFFTEGTEIYNKSGLFYSRRIGGSPINYFNAYNDLNEGDEIVENPTSSRLLNATKITGRTNKGTGIGFFNAVTKSMCAIISDSLGNTREVETDPLTNYNVFVIDQNLKNNSFVNFTNTSVLRNGSTYDANVTGVSTNLNNKTNMWGFSAAGVLTQQYGYFKPDSSQFGHSYSVSAGKKGGNFTGNLNYTEESHTYDPNDLGFLYNNNSRVFSANAGYRMYEPKGKLINAWSEMWTSYNLLYKPNVFTNAEVGMEFGATIKPFFTCGGWMNLIPVNFYDYFEPRVKDRFYTGPGSFSFGFFTSSDYRKKFALDLGGNTNIFFDSEWRGYHVNVSPRYRFSDKFSVILRFSYNISNNQEGSALTAYGSPTIINDTIIFAKRNNTTIENTVTLKYIFNNKMGLNFRLRHYWSKLDYQSFYNLGEDGFLEENQNYTGMDYEGNSLHNSSFNAFNIDMVYSWVFAPGSELRLVWKNSIYDFSQQLLKNYFDDLDYTLNSPQTNSFSVKFLYYIDAANFKKRKRE